MADPDRPTFSRGDRVTWDDLTRDQHAVVVHVARLGTVTARTANLATDDPIEGSVEREFPQPVRLDRPYPRGLRHLRSDEIDRIRWHRAWNALPLVWHGSDLEVREPALRVNNVLAIRTQEQFDEFTRQLAAGWKLLQERPR